MGYVMRWCVRYEIVAGFVEAELAPDRLIAFAEYRFRTLLLQTALSIYYIFPFMHNAGGIRNVI